MIFGSPWASALKARDLDRDPRVLIQSVVTNRDGSDGEFKVRGTAVAESDPDLGSQISTAIAEAVGPQLEVGKFHLYRIDVQDVTFVHWDNRNNDQYLTRWPEGREEVRRGTSATSNGPPEPHHEFLDR